MTKSPSPRSQGCSRHRKTDSPVRRLCARWMETAPLSILTAALADPDPGVRRHALRLAERHMPMTPGFEMYWLKSADHSDPFVRLQLACMLGIWRTERAGIILAELSRNSNDPFLIAGVCSSLNRKNLASFAETVIGQAPQGEPLMQLLRNLLSTAAGVDNGSMLPKLLAEVTRPTSGKFGRWQLAAVAGACSIRWSDRERVGASLEVRPARLSNRLSHLRGKLRRMRTRRKPIYSRRFPLFGRDPDSRDKDVKRLAGLLVATRPAAVQSAAIAALARIAGQGSPHVFRRRMGQRIASTSLAYPGCTLSRAAWHSQLLHGHREGDDPRRADRRRPPPAAYGRTRHCIARSGSEAIRGWHQRRSAEGHRRLQVGSLAQGGQVTREGGIRQVVRPPATHSTASATRSDPTSPAIANKSPLYLLSEILDPNRNLDSRYAEYQALRRTSGRSVASSRPRPRRQSHSAASKGRRRRSCAATS